MADIKSIILNTPAELLQDLISPFIEEQFPDFIRNDYRKLVLFIKSYYEWLEKKDNIGYVSSKLYSAIDIDNNLEEFYSHFRATYLEGFPENLAITTSGNTPNKKTLLKKIKEFYGTKGTESAYRFLFRLLYDSELHIDYPAAKILRASDGVWTEEQSIKVTRKKHEFHRDLESGTVSQLDREEKIIASATIERITHYYQEGVPVMECFLINIFGNFLPNYETIFTPANSEIPPFAETTYSVLGDFFVQIDGSNYTIGDVVYITTGADGIGFSAKVIQTGLAGSVKRIQIQNSGVNYFNTVTAVIVSNNGSNVSAKILLYPTAITKYPGSYKGNRGKISSTSKLYDGEYYQEFSYRLRSSVSIPQYFDVLKSLIHPAGTKMFGSILLENFINSASSASSQITRTDIPVIGAFTPYTFGTTYDLRANGITLSGAWKITEGLTTYGQTGDLYPIGYNPFIGSTSELGPNGKTAPMGTLFVTGGSGGDRGYTYCIVPEGGRTAHNPLGGALGGLTAWKNNKETNLSAYSVGTSPMDIRGLTLWLKPENIGVCGGSMVTGRSMDIWRDASGNTNDALPPKWNAWTTVAQYQGVTVDKLRPTLTVNDYGIPGRTGIRFNGGVIYGPSTYWAQSGLCGGFLHAGRSLGAMSGISWGTGTIGQKILNGQHFNLTRGITLTSDMSIFVVFCAGVTTSGYTASDYGLGLVSSSKKFLEFSSPSSFYDLATPSGFLSNLVTSQDISNTSVYGLLASGTGTSPSVGGLTYSPNGDAASARTVSFNTGAGTAASNYSLISIPLAVGAGNTAYTTSVWLKGNVGGEVVLIRGVASSGHTPVTMTTSWQRFTLTELAASFPYSYFQIGLRQGAPSTINSSATISMWGAEATVGSVPNSGYQSTAVETDHLLYHRSYRDIDDSSSKQTSFYYPVDLSGQKLYPHESGLVGLRNNVGSTTGSRIAFDPHEPTTGITFSLASTGTTALKNISIGEWTREKDNRIRSWYSGVESRNYSPPTVLRISRPSSPGGSSVLNLPASEVSYNTEPLSIGRFGSYCLPVLDAPYSNVTNETSFISAALSNKSYSFNGAIYEILVYTRMLTEVERQIVYSYLSRKYQLQDIIPNSYTRSHPSAPLLDPSTSFWNIKHHPNTAGSVNVLPGVSFANISIEQFINLYGFLYKSSGTRLSDGSILTTDTYTILGR